MDDDAAEVPTATAEQLTTRRLPQGFVDVEIEGEPVRVYVRGLSRFEVLVSKDKEERLGVVAMERMMLHRGMLEPPMTEEQVTDWQKAGPAGEMEPVVGKIAELSGMLEDAAKAIYKSDGSGPES